MPEGSTQEPCSAAPPDVCSNVSSKVETATSNRLEEYVKLAGVLAWPVLVACVLIAFHSTLSLIASKLPDMFAHATKVTAGGLAIEIQRQAESAGNQRLSNAVTSLSGGAVAMLLRLESGRAHSLLRRVDYSSVVEYRVPESAEMGVLSELQKLKLIEFNIDDDQEASKADVANVLSKLRPSKKHPGLLSAEGVAKEDKERATAVSYQLTELGIEAQRSILAALDQQMRRVPTNVDPATRNDTIDTDTDSK